MGGAETDEALALRFEGGHPLVAVQAGYGAYVQVRAVLGGLALGDLLKEDPRTYALGVLQRCPPRPLITGVPLSVRSATLSSDEADIWAAAIRSWSCLRTLSPALQSFRRF
ncbi:hypothetical protein GCM10018775_80860 [Streptomyces umbrinus]|nr:hypothetical protein GCM10018775_80860 [Streptomyces umbrinus]